MRTPHGPRAALAATHVQLVSGGDKGQHVQGGDGQHEDCEHEAGQEEVQAARGREPAQQAPSAGPDAHVVAQELPEVQLVQDGGHHLHDGGGDLELLQDLLLVQPDGEARHQDAADEEDQPGRKEGRAEADDPPSPEQAPQEGGLGRAALPGVLVEIHGQGGDHGEDAKHGVEGEADVQDRKGLDQRRVVEAMDQVEEQDDGEHVGRGPLRYHLHGEHRPTCQPGACGVRTLPQLHARRQQEQLQCRHAKGEEGHQDSARPAARLPQQADQGPRRLMNWSESASWLRDLYVGRQVWYQDLQ
mmetsp:Transcript_117108/g.364648  ORF Transcript_117108/g.364648 Transcript_117108/m.364648 type:complete len:301 (-) Transcript_117108:568-1470(-)